MTYAGYNSGVRDAVYKLSRIFKKEFSLMEQRSNGILLNKGQVSFLKKWLNKKNCEQWIKEINLDEMRLK